MGDELSPPVREFLEQALEVCRRYDRDAANELPFEAWPHILDDLRLPEGGEACRFLMEHLSAASEGSFSYEPLLEALYGPRGGPGPASTADRGGGQMDDDYGYGTRNGHSSSYGGRGPPPDRGGPEEDERLFAGTGTMGSTLRDTRDLAEAQHSSSGYRRERSPTPPGTPSRGSPSDLDRQVPPSPPPRGSDAGGGYDGYSTGGSNRPPQAGGGLRYDDQPPSMPGGRGHDNSYGSGGMGRGMPEDDGPATSECTEQVNEEFWGRRAAVIQQLFSKWDCNQLTNDSFTVKLQDVLGDVVDVSSPESEFVKLSNKHRAARNMKFAALMSALRRDAQATHFRRFGRPMSHSGLSQYAGSYAGSTYEPSDAGVSDAAPHAAGRPTGAGAGALGPQARPVGAASSAAGRRQYSYAESQLSGAVPSRPPSNSGAQQQQQQQRRPPSHLDAVDERRPVGQAYGRDSPAGSMAQSQDQRSQAGYSHAPDRPGSKAGGGGPPSGYAPTDPGSEADHHREVFTNRNRSGHGNILTWGSSSRAITPERKIGGRQVTVDPAQGIPRSQISSGQVLPRDNYQQRRGGY